MQSYLMSLGGCFKVIFHLITARMGTANPQSPPFQYLGSNFGSQPLGVSENRNEMFMFFNFTDLPRGKEISQALSVLSTMSYSAAIYAYPNTVL